jgi:hypothetical protein
MLLFAMLGAANAALEVSAVALNDVTKSISTSTTMAFSNVRPVSGPNGDLQHVVQLQMQNTDSKTVAVQALKTLIYDGLLPDGAPQTQNPVYVIPAAEVSVGSRKVGNRPFSNLHAPLRPPAARAARPQLSLTLCHSYLQPSPT